MRRIDYNEIDCAPNMYSDDLKAEEWDSLKNRGNANQDLLLLELSDNDKLVDLGCGAGYHSIAAARVCKKVYAVDISPQMINRIKTNTKRAGIYNVVPHLKGFLSFDFISYPITKAFSWGALHHLPDVWKGEALFRISRALPVGGKFLIMDLVYSFGLHEREKSQNQYIEEIKKLHGDQIAKDLLTSFENEFITYDWILETLIKKTGLFIEKKISLPNRCWTTFLCQK